MFFKAISGETMFVVAIYFVFLPSFSFLFVCFVCYICLFYWTPALGRKGPMKQGLSVRTSILLFFHLSVSFLRIGSLVFSETQHGVRGPYIVVCDRAGFFGKNLHPTKKTKNGQKWPQNMVFGLFKKITSLVLSGICVKWKFVWFINILQKLYAWEKSSSQVIAKNGSRPMRFQYSLVVNI